MKLALKIFVLILFLDTTTHAGGVPPVLQSPFRAVLIDEVPERFIEVPTPENPVRYYGKNIRNRLIDDLYHSGQVILLSPDFTIEPQVLSLGAVVPDPCLVESNREFSGKVSIEIDQMYFSSGYGPLRQLYGFGRDTGNFFSWGLSSDYRNEFARDQNQFGNAFLEEKGLHTGLDLAHEFNFDVLLAGVKIKHIPYAASLGIKMTVEDAFGKKEIHSITAKADGFYFDFAGHFFYAGADFKLGLALAREAVLKDAFDRLMKKISTEVTENLKKTRTVARYSQKCDGQSMLNLGTDFNLNSTHRFYNRSQFDRGFEPDVIRVDQVFYRSSSFVFEKRSEQTPVSVPGDKFVSLGIGEQAPTHLGVAQNLAARSLSASEQSSSVFSKNLDAGRKDLPMHPALSKYQSSSENFWDGVVAFFTLPFRIYRFYKYNQAYDGTDVKTYAFARLLSAVGSSWKDEVIGFRAGVLKLLEKYGQSNREKVFGSKKVIVAVIDSGVDYNNDDLKHANVNTLINGKPFSGWDFFSADSRGYDDHAHGTEVASMIVGNGKHALGLAPNVTLLPIKVFSPYGTTSSAALFSAFEYAIRWGAQIIVTGWGTEVESKALLMGVELAKQNNVLVVSAAGDLGKDISLVPSYPAAYSRSYENVISVGALANTLTLSKPKSIKEVDQGIWPTNYGTAVDIYAPGYKLRVSRPRNSSHVSSHSGLAAGQVAGVAALLLSYCQHQNVKPLAAELKKSIVKGATAVGPNQIFALNLPGAVEELTKFCH